MLDCLQVDAKTSEEDIVLHNDLRVRCTGHLLVAFLDCHFPSSTLWVLLYYSMVGISVEGVVA